MNRYGNDEENQREATHDFSSLLKQELKKKQVQSIQPQHQELRMMGGLNQYDRHAREFCFILSREADFKA